MVGLIAALGAFAAAVTLSMYACLAVDPGRLSQALMGELPDLTVATAEADGAVATDLAGRAEVDSVFAFDQLELLADDEITIALVTDDTAHLRGTLLTAGRYPTHANEILLGATRAKLWGKHAGDSVTIAVGGRTADYLVTGEMQNLTGYSSCVLLTEAALRQVIPDFAPDNYFLYLADPDTTAAFAAGLAQDPRVTQAVDFRALVLSQQNVYLGGFLYAAVVVVALTVALVGLVLYLVLSTAILRRRQAYGIQKSVGFTTGQLMRQIAAAYVPAAVVGVLLGAAVGLVATRPLFSLMFRSFGLDTVKIDPYLPFTLALAAFLVAFAYGTSQAVAARLRHVSAYALVTE
jgi:putative ABC transport system permease protein